MCSQIPPEEKKTLFHGCGQLGAVANGTSRAFPCPAAALPRRCCLEDVHARRRFPSPPCSCSLLPKLRNRGQGGSPVARWEPAAWCYLRVGSAAPRAVLSARAINTPAEGRFLYPCPAAHAEKCG